MVIYELLEYLVVDNRNNVIITIIINFLVAVSSRGDATLGIMNVISLLNVQFVRAA